jgi:hypothetical protein
LQQRTSAGFQATLGDNPNQKIQCVGVRLERRRTEIFSRKTGCRHLLLDRFAFTACHGIIVTLKSSFHGF